MAALRSRELCVAYKDCFLTTSQLPADPQLKRNILLAEDNPVNRLLAQKLLQKQGHTVTSVNNGREALELWEQNQSHQFDMILMDVQMPEMDGLQATARIREKEMGSGAHIPIIAVTAHAMKGDRERCLAAGMDAYITKPINPLDLVATIRAAWPAEAELPSIPENLIEQGPSSAELLARFDEDCAIDGRNPSGCRSPRSGLGQCASAPAGNKLTPSQRLSPTLQSPVKDWLDSSGYRHNRELYRAPMYL